ncbi:membrane-bound lytic murein transglycosylase C [Vibrio cholerae CP1037(10)]|nr:membrane-bound lytic murein transglycosylase C [Vibrio cholerae CP1037(10)]
MDAENQWRLLSQSPLTAANDLLVLCSDFVTLFSTFSLCSGKADFLSKRLVMR